MDTKKLTFDILGLREPSCTFLRMVRTYYCASHPQLDINDCPPPHGWCLTATTPWIALISCDKNSTNASQEDDIFTLARNRGAVAALLYSLNATTCFVNPEYSDPAQYDQVTDVFVTLSLPSSELIEGQFTTVLGNASRYYDFNPVLLNDSQSQIVYSIVNGTVPGAGYLFATLTSNINGTETSNPPTATPFNGDTSIEASMIQ
ncbi:hypothetical protein C8Q74DRAFT_1282769 [Fomes fomentarius]|nr:hypothetical protein C8Q74DRAFT_1282769 [Fomes fomentarius]